MTNKIQPPLHGPYVRRAEVVAKALEPLLEKEFGAQMKVQSIRRGSDQNLVIRWELPAHVQVVVKKAIGSADPSIWVNRPDPTGSTAVGTDWKNEECTRAYEDKNYDLDATMGTVREAVAYNQERGAQIESNAKAMLSDLDGITVPKDVMVTRNPQTGKYTIRHTVALDELTVKDAKAVIGRITHVLGVMKPSGAPPAKAPTPPAAAPKPEPKPPAAPAPKPATPPPAPQPEQKEGAPKTP